MERITNDSHSPIWVRNESICRYEFARRFVKNKTAVDAACGSGYGSIILSQETPKMIYAFDLDEKTIIQNQEKYQSQKIIKWQIADVTKLPLKDNYVDVFVSLETIEHLKKVEKYLQEVKRVLKKNGLFICSTPNRNLTNPGTSIKDRPFNPYHRFEYSQAEFTEIMHKNFKESEFYGQNFYNLAYLSRLNKISKSISPNLAVKWRQIGKIPKLLFDQKKNHRVKKIKDGFQPEYMLVVARSGE